MGTASQNNEENATHASTRPTAMRKAAQGAAGSRSAQNETHRCHMTASARPFTRMSGRVTGTGRVTQALPMPTA